MCSSKRKVGEVFDVTEFLIYSVKMLGPLKAYRKKNHKSCVCACARMHPRVRQMLEGFITLPLSLALLLHIHPPRGLKVTRLRG